MSSNHPEKSEDQLINRLIIIFLLLGLLLLAISLIFFYFVDDEALDYWGNLSNSVAFEILGVLVMYKFVRYLLNSDVTDPKKSAKIKSGAVILVIIVVILTARGIMKWEINSFIDNSLINLSVEVGGALSLYFLFDQFIEIIQKPRQRLHDTDNEKRDKEYENLALNNAEYRRFVSELQERIKEYENLETRINGILSEQKSYSRDEILRLINADTFGKKYAMADVQSVLGKLTDDGKIFSDRNGEYLKKSNVNQTNRT